MEPLTRTLHSPMISAVDTPTRVTLSAQPIKSRGETWSEAVLIPDGHTDSSKGGDLLPRI